MMNSRFFIPVLASIFPLFFLLSSCEKDVEINDTVVPTPVATGYVNIDVKAMFGDSILRLNSGQYYLTANNDSVKIELYRFYISNIVLTNTNGQQWVHPESYFLCDASDAEAMNLMLGDVPVGDYQSISFMLGVDSARNCSGTQTGALDPRFNMFWSWSSGYIFFKLEGQSPQSTLGNNSITYHIGGYQGPYRAQRTVTFSFPATPALVTETRTPQIQLKADAGELFYSPNLISIATLPAVTGISSDASMLADNYSNMISLLGIQN